MMMGLNTRIEREGRTLVRKYSNCSVRFFIKESTSFLWCHNGRSNQGFFPLRPFLNTNPSVHWSVFNKESINNKCLLSKFRLKLILLCIIYNNDWTSLFIFFTECNGRRELLQLVAEAKFRFFLKKELSYKRGQIWFPEKQLFLNSLSPLLFCCFQLHDWFLGQRIGWCNLQTSWIDGEYGVCWLLLLQSYRCSNYLLQKLCRGDGA